MWIFRQWMLWDRQWKMQKKLKNRQAAIWICTWWTILHRWHQAVVACFINAFVLLPAYGKDLGMTIEAFIEMGSAVNSSVNNLLTFAAIIIFPFNIFKYALTSLVVFFIYKRIRVVLKGDWEIIKSNVKSEKRPQDKKLRLFFSARIRGKFCKIISEISR